MATFISESGAANYTVQGDVFLMPGVTIWSGVDVPLSEPGASGASFFRIDGTVIAGAANGVEMDALGGRPPDTVVVGTTGAVHASDLGSGIFMLGDGAHVVNQGQVSGVSGIYLSSSAFARIENSGAVTGIRDAFAPFQSSGIGVGESNSVQIINSGSVEGDDGIWVRDGYVQVLNSGRVTATDANGAGIDLALSVGANVIRNTGLIEAPQIAILGGVSVETVQNAGDILGDVVLAGGEDVFRGRLGFLSGALFGGDGNDQLASGTGDDIVQGDAGNDRLRGNDGEDDLYGGQGKDTLRGDAGDDVLFGGNGADVFQFGSDGGDDIVQDWTNGQDRLDLTAFRFASFDEVGALSGDRTGGLLIDLRSYGGGKVFIAGFADAGFDAGDVIL